jgi:DNA-binding transcriptional ArsR family regulator
MVRQKAVDILRLFDNNRNNSNGRVNMAAKVKTEDLIRYADMFSAMGSEPRLRIMRLLLSAHTEGMVVGDIATELDVGASTLSHHLEKLKNEDLVRVQREGTFLRYTANTSVLEELLGFLFAECCTRNKAIAPRKIVLCK